MTIDIDGGSRRIGLALSGGGFRAAAFHLGAMRRLHELDLLSKVDLLSCVSGGSIAGATMAMHWPNVEGGLAALETYLSTKSEAVAAVLGGILDPFRSRLDLLAARYDSHLFHGKTLGDLRAGPRLYLNATNLVTGNAFSFITGNGGTGEWNDVVMSDWKLRPHDASGFSLARAVAASSSFPPVFNPLRLDPGEYPPGAPFEYVTLTDGGVYDNMGVNPALSEKNKLDYVIVSDGGSPLELDNRPTEDGFVVLKSAIFIMMQQIRGLEFDRLARINAAKGKPSAMWFSIDSNEGEAKAGDSLFAANVGTNLAALDPVTMEVLTRHGGALVEARVRKYAPELLA